MTKVHDVYIEETSSHECNFSKCEHIWPSILTGVLAGARFSTPFGHPSLSSFKCDNVSDRNWIETENC